MGQLSRTQQYWLWIVSAALGLVLAEILDVGVLASIGLVAGVGILIGFGFAAWRARQRSVRGSD